MFPTPRELLQSLRCPRCASALTQMACGEDADDNLARQLALAEQRRSTARRSSARRSCSARSISARSRITASFSWPRRSPARAPRRFAKLAQSARRRDHRVALRAAGGRPLSQHRRRDRRRRSILGIYRKMHIPDDPLYYEKFYFTPGDTGFRAWNTKYAKIGVLICWDQWFPEGARLTAHAGRGDPLLPHGDRLASVGEGGVRQAQHESWELIQRSHAVANGCLRVRAESHRPRDRARRRRQPVHADGIEFWGQTFVAAPDGQVIARASVDTEEVLIVRLRPRPASNSAARTGRSCATAGSTRTANHEAVHRARRPARANRLAVSGQA